jgi:hypothetical protein
MNVAIILGTPDDGQAPQGGRAHAMAQAFIARLRNAVRLGPARGALAVDTLMVIDATTSW